MVNDTKGKTSKKQLRSLGLFSLEKRRLRVTSSQSKTFSRRASEEEVLICSV